MDTTKTNAAEPDLRTVLIANLTATGMTAEQIAELMNMPVETVTEYITNRH